MSYKNESKQKEYQRNWYARNKARIQSVRARRDSEFREKIRQFKNVPCADCGVRYPYYVMDFDHVRGEKVNDIGNLLRYGNDNDVLAEIEKCEVVCSNCHRIRTQVRRQ